MVVSRSLALTSFDDARPSPLCGPSSTVRCRCTRLMCIPTYCLNCYCYYSVCILCAWRSAATLTNEVEKPSTPNRYTHTSWGDGERKIPKKWGHSKLRRVHANAIHIRDSVHTEHGHLQFGRVSFAEWIGDKRQMLQMKIVCCHTDICFLFE